MSGRPLLTLIALGALARYAGLLGPGHGGDLFAFVTWAEDAARHGLTAYYANGGDANYPPMLYLLWPLGVWLDGAALEQAIRLISIPFDLALGALLFDVVGRATGRQRDGLVAAGFYLLNPAVLLSGPIWGQVDAVGALPMVGAIVAVARGHVAWAGALAVLAGLVKPQFGIAGFVLVGLALFWLRSPGERRRVLVLALAAFATFLAVLLPLGLGPLDYLAVMADTFTRYPLISQFAFNPWGMVFGFGEPDDAWAGVGTALAIAGIAGGLWLLRRRRDLVGLLGVGALLGLVIYFLPTRVHERYLFGALAFLAPLAVMQPRLRWPFLVLSAAVAITVSYVALTSPYPILFVSLLAEVPDWVTSIAAATMTLIGTWTAVRLLELFRPGSQPGSQTGSPPDSQTEAPVPG